jgi:two-component system sensor histidine kinase/response regulator
MLKSEDETWVADGYSPILRTGGTHLYGKATPLYGSDGSIMGVIESIRDITDFKRVEKTLRESSERLKKQQAMLIEMARNKVLFSGDLNTAVRLVTESAARTLDVARVGVWLCDKQHTKISCLDLFECSSNSHSGSLTMWASDYLEYFRALEDERIMSKTILGLSR